MDHKSSVRERVWADLRKVARADSRFHYDFGEFIADFEGGDAACARLTDHEYYRDSKLIFIAPDSCIERLRLQALRDGKKVLMTTYSIKRGFGLLDPDVISPDDYVYASTLDGMERVGRPVTLAEISTMQPVDYLVTGTGAINHEGVRFGKGHGFFDVECGMPFKLGRITVKTPAAAVVHDCQLLTEKLHPEVFDTVADVIFTPTQTTASRTRTSQPVELCGMCLTRTCTRQFRRFRNCGVWAFNCRFRIVQSGGCEPLLEILRIGRGHCRCI